MKMNTDKNWLKRMTELEDGCVISVGGLVESLEQKEQAGSNVVPMKPAFVRFVALARRERSLSLEQFAEKVDVDLVELVKIETETNYKPAIRTVHKIAEFLKVPQKTLLALAGLLQMKDPEFQTAALKFAARSAPVEKLTKQEHSDLEEIVKLLCEQ
ncbi:MAG TPA: helix-turn-helix transcriptional regulator [Bryobacteraceae bacterium]|jgi:transcriptional regulator with XRE-family HTH domain|nr:helix-turn-helix transcriptional regulator [Bryobacteraceae bacterium]